MLQLLLWLGFLVHRSPRFPGSITGWVLATVAALLLVVPSLLYSAIKRIGYFKRITATRLSLGTILNWHIYTGIIGSILAILHTGHHFESNVGIWLTTMMMLTVLSGFVGRYFLSYASKELSEKQDLLNLLATQYNQIIGQLSQNPGPEIMYAVSHGRLRQAINSFFGMAKIPVEGRALLSIRALELTESIADVEYAIKTHELLKRRTASWLKVHIATSCAFYILLIFHIWLAFYFGIRTSV